MKKKIILTIVASLFGVTITAIAQVPGFPTPTPVDSLNFIPYTEVDPIEFPGIIAPWDDEIGDGHRMPASPQSLPIVTLDTDHETLNFTGVEACSSITYFIIDEESNVCLTDELTLTAGNTKTIALAALAGGDYTVILLIGRRYYIAEFTI